MDMYMDENIYQKKNLEFIILQHKSTPPRPPEVSYVYI